VIDQELLDDCVHCGFCLPTCPTFVLWGEEMDSPRGRILLMDRSVQAGGAMSEATVTHVDRCLGCMACLTSCPSGVKYDRLIEQARAQVEETHERPRSERVLRALLFGVLPHPRRLRAALALAPLGRRLPVPKTFRPLAELAPRWRSNERPPELTAAEGERLGRVGLLAGCVQSAVFGDVNTATARVLAAEGYDVACPAKQGCCGALAVHAGRHEEGLTLARRTIDAFERLDLDLVVTNAAGCGSNLKDYAHLLADDPAYAERAAAFSARVRDVSEVVGTRAVRNRLELRVAFQDSCHLAHAQGVRDEPRALLASVPGLTVLEPAEQALCCGSAGIYNLVQPEAAAALGERKARNVLATEPDVYASGNPGCLVQITHALRAAGRPLPAFHPIELVDASIRGVPADELRAGARR
jgi:glycolate oxidase iron-sulfur subunit